MPSHSACILLLLLLLLLWEGHALPLCLHAAAAAAAFAAVFAAVGGVMPSHSACTLLLLLLLGRYMPVHSLPTTSYQLLAVERVCMHARCCYGNE